MMRTKPISRVDAAKLRDRAELHEEFRERQERRPMMTDLYRKAKVQLRKHLRAERSKGRSQVAAGNPQRLVEELQVHQIELEMQNTELQRARNELEVALEKFTDLYDFAPVGYFSLDHSGVILEANLTGAAMLNLERSRLVNRSLLVFMSPASRPEFLTFLKKTLSGHADRSCEVQLVKQGGGTFWAGLRSASAVFPKGTSKWCRVAFGDITDRKNAEEAMRESEKRYRSLFELVPMAVYSCDASGAIQKFNRYAVKLWGREPVAGDTEEQFCGAHKLFRPDGSFMPHEKSPMAGVVRGEIPTVRDAEVLIERPDGSRISVVVNIRQLKNERGELAGAINCFYDISARKQAEESRRRIAVLAASNRKLELEIVERQAAEASLKESQRQQTRLLAESIVMQGELRKLSRQVLHAQEEERKRISRELHDVIAQTLTGINVHLAALKSASKLNLKDLEKRITRTQSMVEQSVNIVHQFARELRPAVLDDLGLLPALEALTENFRRQTGIQISLTAFAGITQLTGDKGTVFYRIAQEALNNVARHAQASRADLNIQKSGRVIRMSITDNGKGFHQGGPSNGKASKRLGLLGMRERLEMVNGSFSIISAPGKGTTVEAQIPLHKIRGGGGGADRGC